MTAVHTKFRLDINRAALLIIDVQEKLVPAMNQPLYTQLLQNARLLREGFTAFGRPVLATEQYPQGLGHTISELSSGITTTVTKRAFSCCGEADFLAALEKTGADQVVVVGMETHVCVYQTVLDLLDKGYAVHLVRDAVASRFVSDYENALRLAGEAGAVVTTTETALFQFVPVAEGDGFKTISKLVRTRTA